MLVIDADVLRSAGQDVAASATSGRCRGALLAVRRVCHRAAVTEAMLTEWDAHASHFGRTWRASMESIGKLRNAEPIAVPGLAEALGKGDALTAQETVDLDAHLIEAACAADHRVISRDDHARNRFAEASGRCPALREVVWVNPTDAADDVIAWLEAGAPTEAWRTLDARLTQHRRAQRGRPSQE